MNYTEDGPWAGFILSPLALYAHAAQPKPETAEIHYILRQGVAGPGEHLIAEENGWVFVTTDVTVWQADVNRSGIESSISPLLYVERGVVFGRGQRGGDRPVIDLAKAVGLR